MKLSTFIGILIAIASVVAVAALIISKRKIKLGSEDEYDLDDYDVIDDDYDIGDEIQEATDSASAAFEDFIDEPAETIKKKIVEPVQQIVEPVKQTVTQKIVEPAKATINQIEDNLLDDVDDLLGETNIKINRF